MKKRIKVREVIELMEKDGYRWTKGEFWGGLGSCAMGQVARNLGYDGVSTVTEVGFSINDALLRLTGDTDTSIIRYNDSRDTKSLAQVVEWAKERYEPFLDNEIVYEDGVTNRGHRYEDG
jgi:hypothetical protein